MRNDSEGSLAIVFILGTIFWAVVFWLCFYINPTHADQEPRYKIAVLDTGFNPSLTTEKVKLCKTGHYDFLTRSSNVNYTHPHGTRIAAIIANKLKDVDYCLVIFQMYKSDPSKGIASEDAQRALNDSVGLKVAAINLSFGGPAKMPLEREALEATNTVHIPVFAAAGNNSTNLAMNCNFYPACYKLKNMIVVGAQDYMHPKERAEVSNYGRGIVDVWAPGYSEDDETRMVATSYATPRALAEYILFLEHKRLHPVPKSH